MKKTKKIIASIILIMMIVLCISPNVLAGNVLSSSKINVNEYKPDQLKEEDYKGAFDITEKIIGVLTTVGIVVSVIMIIILGIRYMAGSVEQRSEYKKTMMPMLIGIILIFASSTIVSIIYSMVSEL